MQKKPSENLLVIMVHRKDKREATSVKELDEEQAKQQFEMQKMHTHYHPREKANLPVQKPPETPPQHVRTS